ncbi:MAG: aminotransferase class I/II-fold pyridoxal phosphate-dependent enzyme [Lachnospiraceae bacterium]|nr:aminotransferase class I/II-fold pyridoxal phosphate-dependent enzyme [Lachnospiraceae bacterium]
MKEAFHGSDVEKIEELYGIPAEEIISFAANVSPLGVSEKYLQGITEKLRSVERYPDREYTALRKALGRYCKAEPRHMIVGGGSSELIGAVIKHKKTPKALIIAPAYAEYERNVNIAGGEADYYYLKSEDGFEFDIDDICGALSPEYDILIVCNPVNPTSTAVASKDIERLLDKCDELGIVCAVDETYIDFADEAYDVSPLTKKHPCLFVIRSMSKFFCAPGLRLGFGITSNESLLREIGENKDPWSVSSLSNEAAILMLSDEAYIKKVKKYMSEERDRICKKLDELKNTGISYIRPKANFVLVRLPGHGPSSHELFERAVRERMMIRDCADFRGLDETYIRFCFMMREDNDRLLSLIKEAYT